MGQNDKAIETLEQCLSSSKSEVDFHVINILVELYMGIGEFEAAINLITKVSAMRSDPLPVDIVANLGICEIYIGNSTMAEVYIIIIDI